MCQEKKMEESEMSAMLNVERPCTILESIEKSCQEVKLMREGKIPKRSWQDFRKQMADSMIEDD